MTSDALNTLDDVYASLMWVESVTDPSLFEERLHQAFLETIFFTLPDEERAPRAVRLRTAADRLLEQQELEEMRQGLREINGSLRDDSEAGDAEQLDETDEDDEEGREVDLEEAAEADLLFANWVQTRELPAPRQHGETTVQQKELDAAFEYELKRVGLATKQAGDAETRQLPSRLASSTAVASGAVTLASPEDQHLSGAATARRYKVDVNVEYKALWILGQLSQPGQPLAHSTRVSALLNAPASQVLDNPVVVAVATALRKMTDEHLEPGHLMMYYQSLFHPLLNVLLEGSPTLKNAEHDLVSPSFAYSTVTGRRQVPSLSDAYVGFSHVCTQSIGDGNSKWRNGDLADYATRKPCFIELGRLLVRILELNVLCEKLETQRQKLLLMLRASTDATVHSQYLLLEATLFNSVVESDMWAGFVDSLTPRHRRNPYWQLKALGLEVRFEEYSITANQYHTNLSRGVAETLCPAQTMSLEEWARSVGQELQPPRDWVSVVSLFNDVIVEQFSKLPVLTKKVFDLFCTEGDVIVHVKRGDGTEKVYPISSFLLDHPDHFLQLDRMCAEGSAEMHLVLSEDSVRRALKTNELYHHRVDSDWYHQRESAIDLLVTELLERVSPKVREEMVRQCTITKERSLVSRLGALCAVGGYEPTRLCVEEYADGVLTWQPQWNIVEALPASNDLPTGSAANRRARHRVCAAYCAPNRNIYFAFTDEVGLVLETVRWLDTGSSTEPAALRQAATLEQAFASHSPSVIVVGASSTLSLTAMRFVRHFAVTNLFSNLGVKLPVIWGPADVARFCAATSFLGAEFPDCEEATRVCIALARLTRDPFETICTLFDNRQTVLRLFAEDDPSFVEKHRGPLYNALAWEMTLWAASCGVWLDTCAMQRSGAAALQFVPGLDLSRALQLSAQLKLSVPANRQGVWDLLNRLFGVYVAVNAASALRVPPPAPHQQQTASVWSVLDQTLIPLEWYPLAYILAQSALGTGAASVTSLGDFMLSDVATKHQLLEMIDTTNYVYPLLSALPSASQPPGHRELELVMDEMLAAGARTMPRPYRRMSTQELMFSLTGIVYLDADAEGSDPGAAATASASLAERCSRGVVLHQGDYVEGFVTGVTTGDHVSIRVRTSSYITADIDLDDIDDPVLQDELRNHANTVKHFMHLRKTGGMVDTTYRAPAWLARDAPIQGRVIRCNYSRCQLYLRWCPARALTSVAAKDESRELLYCGRALRAAALPGPLGGGSASSAGFTLHTELLAEAAAVFASKVSRHNLFRNVSRTEAQDLLRESNIGEVVIRPAKDSLQQCIFVVKVGEISMSNWTVTESRRANGSLFYTITDGVIGMNFEFADVDEVLSRFVAPMIEQVRGIRRHRRFAEADGDAELIFDEQRRAGLDFLYAFVESGDPRTPYVLSVNANNRRRNFKLHCTHTALYVKLPLRGERTWKERWVQCSNAEQVSATVKHYALESRY